MKKEIDNTTNTSSSLSPLLKPKSEQTLSFPSISPTPTSKRKTPNTTSPASLSPNSNDEDDIKPSATKKAKSKKTNESGSTAKTGGMTQDIKEALVDHLRRVAYSAMQKDDLAAELGITKKQLDNATCSGRTNLRSKLIKAARDL